MTTSDSPPLYVIEQARLAAMQSPCLKSRRGVVLFNREDADSIALIGIVDRNPQEYPAISKSAIAASGFNGPPEGFTCTGTDTCRRDCSKLCLHAEQRAIYAAGALDDLVDLELVHVKVENGQVVPGGGPICWQCSKLVVEVKLRGVWLFIDCDPAARDRDTTKWPADEPVWRFYTAHGFHRETLRNCRIGDP